MSDFAVWAPSAEMVNLLLNIKADLRETCEEAFRLRMNKAERGWWRLSVPLVTPGTDYAFSIDGGDPLPDPRSAWQPYGVHGPSRVVDHSTFAWTDQDWQPPALSTGVVYELHVGTFTPVGTFESAVEKLDHLVELGITHVELMPVGEFPGSRGWGYDCVDVFAPHHAYGGPEGLKRFVDGCHARGLATILDVVYNHLGPDGNYLSQFGPYFTERYNTPWGEAVNLDGPGSIEVRRFLCDNARMWLRDYHFDGLRLDAIHAIYDASAIHFLEQLHSEVEQLESETGRRYELIAENDLNDPRVVTPVEAGGYGLDAQWNDDFHHALHTELTGEHQGYYADFTKLEDVAKALKDVYVYDGRESGYRQRIQGRRVRGLSAHRFVGFLQNHDQVGNRAQGERSSQILSVRQLKVGAALVLCAPFVPMLFQGEEFGSSSPFLYFTDHSDPEIATAVSEGRRREFASFQSSHAEVPDPQASCSFEMSKLNWSELSHPPHDELLRWYKNLISMRRSNPALLDGSLDDVSVEFNEAARWLVLYRGPVAVVCNLAGQSLSVTLAFSGTALIASDPNFTVRDNLVELPGESIAILENATLEK